MVAAHSWLELQERLQGKLDVDWKTCSELAHELQIPYSTVRQSLLSINLVSFAKWN